QSLIWVGVSPTGRVDVWDLVSGTWSETYGPTGIDSSADASATRTLTVSVTGTTTSTVSISIGSVSISNLATSVTSGTTAGLYSSNTDSSSLNWPIFDSF